jgi:hypothetical protein
MIHLYWHYYTTNFDWFTQLCSCIVRYHLLSVATHTNTHRSIATHNDTHLSITNHKNTHLYIVIHTNTYRLLHGYFHIKSDIIQRKYISTKDRLFSIYSWYTPAGSSTHLACLRYSNYDEKVTPTCLNLPSNWNMIDSHVSFIRYRFICQI